MTVGASAPSDHATDPLPDEGRLLATFSQGPVAFLGVLLGSGPHVTPQLVSSAAGRLWFVTPERSVKVKALRARPQATITTWNPGDSSALVVQSTAHVIDPAHPGELTDDIIGTVLSGVGLASYAVANTTEALRSVWQAATAQLSGATDRRVLVSVRPDHSRLIRLCAGSGAVLGWETPAGPVAVGGAWDEKASHLTLSSAAREALAAWPEARAAVAVDSSTGKGAADRAGTMLRGRGRLVGDGVRLTVERVTTWSGGEGTTTSTG